jgi:hypothetical protein
MRLFEALRQRAKWIETEADTLVREHGKNAYAVASDMERQANDLSAKFFWHAIKKIILSRPPGDGIGDLLPPVGESNCISCLVGKFSGMYESGGPPNLQACVSCLTRRRGGSLDLHFGGG